VDVRDAAEAMILAMEKGRPGERYLIGGANMTIEAFLERLSRIADLPMPKLKLPRGVLLASVGGVAAGARREGGRSEGADGQDQRRDGPVLLVRGRDEGAHGARLYAARRERDAGGDGGGPAGSRGGLASGVR
jgi:hypothetical protein